MLTINANFIETNWSYDSLGKSLKQAKWKCFAKCLRRKMVDNKVADSNNVKSAMYHLAINFSDKLHNSRLSQPAITRNNTLNIDKAAQPKIDNRCWSSKIQIEHSERKILRQRPNASTTRNKLLGRSKKNVVPSVRNSLKFRVDLLGFDYEKVVPQHPQPHTPLFR